MRELHQEKIDSLIKLFSNGHIEDTLKSAKSLITKFPNEAILQNISGACYASLGIFDKAISHYDNALLLKPDYAEANNNLGITLLKLGKAEDAILNFKKAISLKPEYFQAQNNLANAFKDLGQLDKAINLYDDALDLSLIQI